MSASARILDQEFIKDLKNGMLKPYLKLVHNDDTLDLQIRANYINIYYRGGNLIRINRKRDVYHAHFDRNYLNKDESNVPKLPDRIQSTQDVQIWKECVPHLKYEMDLWFRKHRKDEREFQQVLVRENNFGRIANGTDYYICDIEYSGNAGRFDLVAIHWPSTGADRKKTINRGLSIIEMKYGDGAIKGSSGLVDHITKLNELIQDPDKLEQFAEEMMNIFNQKRQLNLIPDCKHGIESMSEIIDGKVDYIVVIANHDPASGKLFEELKQVQQMDGKATIRIATSNFSGYGLYDESIFLLDEFLKLNRKS
jgi:hypothetical protein